MKAIAMLRSWIRGATRRSTFEREMDAELRFHLESYADDRAPRRRREETVM